MGIKILYILLSYIIFFPLALGIYKGGIDAIRYAYPLLVIITIGSYVLYIKVITPIWVIIRKLFNKLNAYMQNHRNDILLFAIAILLCIPIVLYYSYYQNSGTICESIASLLINIVGTFVALFFTYLLLKPKFKINNVVARSLNNHINILVKNDSLFAKLYAIKVELFYCGKFDQADDEIIDRISLDSDSQVTYLTHKFNSDSRHNRYFVFQSVSCFHNQWAQLKCRISATNTISNIVDIKDEYIDYESVQWGEYVGDTFYEAEQLYAYKERQRVRKLIKFNETISPVLRPRTSKNGDNDVYQTALTFLSLFKQNYDDFPCLNDVEVVLQDMVAHITKLKCLLEQNDVLRPIHKDWRDKLLLKINQELRCISTHLENSLERKK